MNEAQTRLNLIDPAIRAAGWTAENDCQVLVEQTVAFEVPMQKRVERAGSARKSLPKWVKDENAKGFYTFVLDNYVQEGVDVFTRDDALSQLIVTKYHTLPDASRILGDLRLISTGFATLQRAVYAAQEPTIINEVTT